MAKATVHGGASQEPVPIRREMLGGDPKLAGKRSETSTRNEQTLNETKTVDPPSPVQTTENPSKQESSQGNFTAHSMGTGGQKTSKKKAAKKAAQVDPDEFE